MKFIAKIIKNLVPSGPKKTFYAVVKCADCGENVKIRINLSSDFQIEYTAHNPKHAYTVKKEIIGKDCFNLMGLTIALTKDIKVLFTDVKACEFINFGVEG